MGQGQTFVDADNLVPIPTMNSRHFYFGKRQQCRFGVLTGCIADDAVGYLSRLTCRGVCFNPQAKKCSCYDGHLVSMMMTAELVATLQSCA